MVTEWAELTFCESNDLEGGKDAGVSFGKGGLSALRPGLNGLQVGVIKTHSGPRGCNPH